MLPYLNVLMYNVELNGSDNHYFIRHKRTFSRLSKKLDINYRCISKLDTNYNLHQMTNSRLLHLSFLSFIDILWQVNWVTLAPPQSLNGSS